MTKKEKKFIKTARLIMKGYFQLSVFYAGLDDLLKDEFLDIRNRLGNSIIIDLSYDIFNYDYLLKKKNELLYQLRKAFELSKNHPLYLQQDFDSQIITDIENVT